MVVAGYQMPDGGGGVEPLLLKAQPRLCTPVDIRSKKFKKFSLFLTFRPARRDPDVSELEQQAVSYQADRA